MKKFDIFASLKNSGQVFNEISDELDKAVQEMAEHSAKAAFNMGVDFVQQKLHSTRLDYQNHFHYDKLDDRNHLIHLDEEANHLEDGYEHFDMKPGLLNGPKARVSKDGHRFNIIPFRHSSGNPAVKSALSNSVSSTGEKIDLNKTQKGQYGLAKQGRVGTVVSTPTLHPHLKGMTKYQKKYDHATQSQIMTFRVVSDKSPQTSWQHPGFKGVHAFDEMERFLSSEIDRFVSSYKI